MSTKRNLQRGDWAIHIGTNTRILIDERSSNGLLVAGHDQIGHRQILQSRFLKRIKRPMQKSRPEDVTLSDVIDNWRAVPHTPIVTNGTSSFNTLYVNTTPVTFSYNVSTTSS